MHSRSNPAISKVNPSLPPEPWGDTRAAAVCGLASALSAAWAGWLRGRRKRLLRDGEVLRGEVLSCAAVPAEDDGFLNITLRYRFATPTQELVVGKCSTSRRDQPDFTRTSPATPLAVLYLSDRNYAVL